MQPGSTKCNCAGLQTPVNPQFAHSNQASAAVGLGVVLLYPGKDCPTPFPYSQRGFMAPAPPAHSLRGWEGAWKGHRAHDIPQGRISSPLAPLADVCVTCPPVKQGHVLPPASSSSSSLWGHSQDFPTLSGLHCIPQSCREPLCSQLQLFSQTERGETIC